MKKHRLKTKFLEELSNTPIVSAVCNRLGISRQTVYRWLAEDSEFKKEYDKSLTQGVDQINDLAESKLINQIQKDEAWAIRYWLDNHKVNYIRPRPKQFMDFMGWTVNPVETGYSFKIEEVGKETVRKYEAHYRSLMRDGQVISEEKVFEQDIRYPKPKETTEEKPMVGEQVSKNSPLNSSESKPDDMLE